MGNALSLFVEMHRDHPTFDDNTLAEKLGR
jgi:hypothetical protein